MVDWVFKQVWTWDFCLVQVNSWSFGIGIFWTQFIVIFESELAYSILDDRLMG